MAKSSAAPATKFEELFLAACRKLRIRIHGMNDRFPSASPTLPENAKFLDSVITDDVKEFKEILAAHQALYEALSALVAEQYRLHSYTDSDDIVMANPLIQRAEKALALADAAQGEK